MYLANFEFFSLVRTYRILDTARLRSSKENPNFAQIQKAREVCCGRGGS